MQADLSLEVYGTCTLDGDGCTTCGDIAIPVRVVEVLEFDALVEDRLGQRAEVALDFIDNPRQNDILMVHMGVALSKVGGHAS